MADRSFVSAGAVRRFARLDPETHEQGREHDEDVRLQERDEELQEIDADDEPDGPQGDTYDSNTKIKPSRETITMCPPSMLANRRMQSANGFVKSPRISIGIMIGQSAQCTPPVRCAR